MATKPPSNMKPTLDKDLDKITRVEEATLHVTQQLAGLGAGFMFVVLAAVFAGAFVTGTAGSVIIIAAVALSAYMAINISANDVTNNVGPAVGAKAMPLAVALIVAAICEIAGALITGGNVVETISSGIINVETIPDRTAFSWAMLSALLAAGLLVNISTWTRAPISTTHTVVGGVAGAGMAAYGAKAVEWLSLGSIAFAWVLAPFISAAIAIAILTFIKEFIVYRDDKIDAARRWVPVHWPDGWRFHGLSHLGRIAPADACLAWSCQYHRAGDRPSRLAALRADHPQTVGRTGKPQPVASDTVPVAARSRRRPDVLCPWGK